jgi:hypothetical protein
MLGKSWLNGENHLLNVIWNSQLFVLDIYCPREIALLQMASNGK